MIGDVSDLGVKPRDAWWTVLVIDPIAVPLLRGLIRLPQVQPVHVTIVALTLGAAAVPAFATGHLIVGVILFQVHFVLDCVDGKLARVTSRTSAWGAFLDLAGGTAVVGANYAALGSRALEESAHGASATLVLLVTFFIAAWLHLYRRLALGEQERTTRPVKDTPSIWSLRRLRPYPGSVEVDALLLFVFPLFLPLSWFPIVAGLSALFYLGSALDSVRRVWRRR